MKGIRYSLASFTMNNRLLVAGVLFGITAFFAVGLSKVELKTIFSDLFPKSHPFVQTYKDHPNFGNPLTVTISVGVAAWKNGLDAAGLYGEADTALYASKRAGRNQVTISSAA